MSSTSSSFIESCINLETMATNDCTDSLLCSLISTSGVLFDGMQMHLRTWTKARTFSDAHGPKGDLTDPKMQHLHQSSCGQHTIFSWLSILWKLECWPHLLIVASKTTAAVSATPRSERCIGVSMHWDMQLWNQAGGKTWLTLSLVTHSRMSLNKGSLSLCNFRCTLTPSCPNQLLCC